MAVCCQNMTPGALRSRSAPPMLVGALFQKFILFWNTPSTVKENAGALILASKEILLEVSADKTKYMVMSRDQNAEQSHILETDNNSFELMEEFRYLGTTFTNQNSIQEQCKSRLKSGW